MLQSGQKQGISMDVKQLAVKDLTVSQRTAFTEKE